MSITKISLARKASLKLVFIFHHLPGEPGVDLFQKTSIPRSVRLLGAECVLLSKRFVDVALLGQYIFNFL